MKNKDNLIRAAITVFVAIAVITAFWIGLGVGTRPIEVAAPEPEAGEGDVYSIEIWGGYRRGADCNGAGVHKPTFGAHSGSYGQEFR